MIPNETIVGKVDESIFLFDRRSVYKIIDEKGKIFFRKMTRGYL